MSTPASATPATLLASMLVGSVVSMVPKYAVTIWYCGKGAFGSAGLGTEGGCTKAAARKVCFPHAAAAIAAASKAYFIGWFLDRNCTAGPTAGKNCIGFKTRCDNVRKAVRNPVREGLLVWAAVLAGLAIAQLVPLRGLTGALAVAAFLWAP